MLTEVDGFVLNEISYGETSKIIHLFTREYGLIGIMCKGCKNLKNRNRILTLRYTYAHYNIYYKENKLSLLKDGDIINPLKNIKSDITLLSYITYLSELTSQVIKQNNSNINKLYDNFINGILKIENKLDPLVITNILELKYLENLGVLFSLDECVKCGNKDSIVTISSDTGGYVCKDCLTNEIIVNSKTIKMIRMYYYVDIKKIKEIKIEDEIKNQINIFLNNYYERYTGLYLNSKKFLEKIMGIN